MGYREAEVLRKYLAGEAMDFKAPEKGIRELKADLAEHREHCEAKERACPYETKVEKKIENLERDEKADAEVSSDAKAKAGKADGIDAVRKLAKVVDGIPYSDHRRRVAAMEDLFDAMKGLEWADLGDEFYGQVDALADLDGELSDDTNFEKMILESLDNVTDGGFVFWDPIFAYEKLVDANMPEDRTIGDTLKRVVPVITRYLNGLAEERAEAENAEAVAWMNELVR